ncbi:MAG: hypothetical protein ACTSO4_01945 [Promethearchaeota archaeon]
MNFKESFDEVALRLSAWWDHEKTDRPVISYYHPKKGVHWEDILMQWVKIGL